MKRLFIGFILIISVFRIYAQTTLEEWNYITKGYKIQKESGLDMKKGYVLKDILKTSYPNELIDRTFNFKELIRIKDNEVSALMVEVILKLNNQKSILYFCIPKSNSSPEIINLYLKQTQNLSNKDFILAYSWALSQLISKNYLYK